MSTRSGSLPTRAACAGSEVPARAPPRRSGTARRCSPATSFRPTMPRTHWTPSPCGRLSRPPRCGATRTTTTGPPPRPGGNSGRCACPEPTNSGSAGTARTLPTFTHMPVGRVGAQLYPGGIAARYRNTARGLVRPISNRTNETVPNDNRDRAPQQPIAASFGAAVLYRGFKHWYLFFPTPFCLATAPGPLAADRCSIVRGCSRPPPHLRPQAAPQLLPTVTAAGGGASHPARSYGASWRTAALGRRRAVGSLRAVDDLVDRLLHELGVGREDVVPCALGAYKPAAVADRGQ